MTDPQAPPAAGMRVVLWGTSDTGKPRVRLLRVGLRGKGVEVIECRADIWAGVQDKSQIHGAGRWLRQLARLVAAYPVLAWRDLRLPAHDWVLLGYPAIPDIFVIRLLAWLRGARVAMDWFLSAYDTVVLDRALVGPRHPLAVVLWCVEWLAPRLADRVFMDTRTHARRMETLFHLPRGSCATVWVGAEDAFLAPSSAPASHRAPGAPLRVLFYGQFIPLHGVPTIIQAARLLRDAPVDFLLVGRGQEAPRVRAMLDDVPLPRLQWLPWLDYPELARHISEADVCLGIFGASDKAASVIPNKVFQVLAAGKPVITRDSPAIRELLQDTPSTRLVRADDAAALAAAIMERAMDPAMQHAADHGGSPQAQAFTAAAIGRQLLQVLDATNANAGSGT